MSFYNPELLEMLNSTLMEIIGLFSSDDEIHACEESKNYESLVNYTCTGGKLIRGLEAILSAQAACEKFKTKFVLKEAVILGVCVEVLEGSFLVADDIMDGACTRRGKPSWFKVDGVGLNGINDSFILLNLCKKILTHYFYFHQNFTHMLLFLQDIVDKTCLGQKIDADYSFQRKSAAVQPYSASSLKSLFSLERHQKICQYKTSYYTFFLPVGLGILYAIPPKELLISFPVTSEKNIFSEISLLTCHPLFSDLKDVCLGLGVLFQCQDDYIDVYSDPRKTGKVGTDIEDGKLSFLLVLALNHKDDVIREKANWIVIEHYAINEKSHIDAMKNFYKEIQLEAVYREHEERMVNIVKEKIALCSSKHIFFPEKMLLELLESLISRKM